MISLRFFFLVFFFFFFFFCSWGRLSALTNLVLSNNRLNGSIIVLRGMQSVSVLDLSQNRLRIPSAAHGDLGEFLDSFVPPNLSELYVDDNEIAGIWSTGWINIQVNECAHARERGLESQLVAG
jgi:hypothetical protein